MGERVTCRGTAKAGAFFQIRDSGRAQNNFSFPGFSKMLSEFAAKVMKSLLASEDDPPWICRRLNTRRIIPQRKAGRPAVAALMAAFLSAKMAMEAGSLAVDGS